MDTTIRFCRRYLNTIIRSPIISIARLLSLILPLSVALVIFNYSASELKTDMHNQNYERIYRILLSEKGGTSVPAVLADNISGTIPEIEAVTRVITFDKSILNPGENKALHSDLIFVDSSFFKIFSNITSDGTLEYALAEAGSIVLTEEDAKRHFGDKNPIGRTLLYDRETILTVTAVYKKPKGNSSFPYKSLVSFSTLYNTSFDEIYSNALTSWNNWSIQEIFVLTTPRANIEDLEKKIFKSTPWVEANKMNADVKLSPLKGYYFSENGGEGNLKRITVLLIISSIVLLIGIINYLNLTITNTVARIKENTIRKLFGGSALSISGTVLLYTIIDFLVSMLISYILVLSTLHIIQGLIEIPFIISSLINIQNIIISVATITLISIISSIFPLKNIYKDNVAHSLSQNSPSVRKHRFISIPIMVQFIASIFAISIIIIINRQLNYGITSFNYNTANLITVDLTQLNPQNRAAFRNDILSIPGTEEVILTTYCPGKMVGNMQGPRLITNEGETPLRFKYIKGSWNFPEIFNLKIISGNTFTQKEISSKEVLINQSFASKFEIHLTATNAIMMGNKSTYHIAGILEDYNFEKVDKTIEPLVIFNDEEDFGFWGFYSHIVHSHTNPELVNEYKIQIKEVFEKHYPGYPSDIMETENYIESIMSKEISDRRMTLAISLILIAILLLGVLGVTTYTIERRKREIGIRKVLGAESLSIVYKLNKSFVVQAIISTLIAVPLAIYYGNRWLESYAYKTDIPFWLCIVSGLIILVLTLISSSIQSINAANLNPVDTIKEK